MDSANRSSGRPARKSRRDSTDPPAPWGPVGLPEGQRVYRRIGPLELWLLRTEGEIRIASVQSAQETAGPGGAPPETEHRTDDTPPDAAAWSRWAIPEGVDSVHLRPVFPDRQVVVEPEIPFTLLPSTEAQVYVRVPLSVQLVVQGEDRPLTLAEIRTVTLSDTWWGDFADGELSYWLHTTARRQIDPSLLQPYRAICRLYLSNRSTTELKVEKLTLRVGGLSLFAGGPGVGGFWADTARVRYLGDTEGSQIDMSGSPPEEAGEATLVAPPREPLPKGLRARTFDRLRSLPGMG